MAGSATTPTPALRQQDRIDFRASLGRAESASGQRSIDMQIKVKIRVEQADVPAGLSRMFNLLEKSAVVEVAPDEAARAVPATEESSPSD
jgi:hypothetical protein